MSPRSCWISSAPSAALRTELVDCNHAPALISYRGDRPEGVFLLGILDGKITDFYAVRNPDKLLAVALPRQITRG